MWIADAGDEILAVFFTKGGEVGLEVVRSTGGHRLLTQPS
jgi:hypothetical protein